MHVIKTDRYDQRAYRNARELLAPLQELEESLSDTVSDIFQLMYQANPVLEEETRLNKTARQVLQKISATPDFPLLRDVTHNDLVTSALVTRELGLRILKQRDLQRDLKKRSMLDHEQKMLEDLLQQNTAPDTAKPDEKPDEKPEDQDGGDGDDQGGGEGDGEGQGGDQGQGDGEGDGEGDDQSDDQSDGEGQTNDLDIDFQAVETRLQEIEKETDQLERPSLPDMQQALHVAKGGLDAGKRLGIHELVDPKERMRLANQLASSRKLTEIMEQVGRMERVFTEKRKTEAPEIPQEIIGIRRGSDLSRALPMEFALAANPALQLLFLKNFAERSMQVFSYKAQETLGAGPVICLIDISGSMDGPKDVWARALFLAIATMCREDGRDLHAALFESQVVATGDFKYSSGHVNLNELLSMATRGVSGGTSFSRALTWAVNRMPERDESLQEGAPDIIMITDGEDRFHQSFLQGFQRAKEEKQFSVYAFAVGAGLNTSSLQQVADEIYHIENLTDDEKSLGDLIKQLDKRSLAPLE